MVEPTGDHLHSGTLEEVAQGMGQGVAQATIVVAGSGRGRVVASAEPLSFWGGVDPTSARVIDAHHVLAGADLAGAILVMPGSRGSCSGSGVLLDMALRGNAPAAFVFAGPEDVLTLGALVAAEMFGRTVPIVRVDGSAFQTLLDATTIAIGDGVLDADGLRLPLVTLDDAPLTLTPGDRAMLDGAHGEAARIAMRLVTAMATRQGASRLVDVSRAHVDGCIYASPANLVFAERMADLGARTRVPTTTNAISVDRENWQAQGVDPAFGGPAARLADAYVRMGCAPSFTCAPYLIEPAPRAGDTLGWSESNAVIFANSVLGARTAKHPDFLDLCIALTGRAPLAGPYVDEARLARRIVDVAWPEGAEASLFPVVGYAAGLASPDRVPLLRGLAGTCPSRDDLKALCAAFGTTSAAAMLHIEGITPEADGALAPDADVVVLGLAELAATWASLAAGPETIDLVAFGSPHASIEECRQIAAAFAGRRRREDVAVIVTASRAVMALARDEGVLARLEASGVRMVPDLCWCSISEPVFPTATRAVLTNSGKYAHYGPGLCGRPVRFAGLAECVAAALEGTAPQRLPVWLGQATS